MFEDYSELIGLILGLGLLFIFVAAGHTGKYAQQKSMYILHRRLVALYYGIMALSTIVLLGLFILEIFPPFAYLMVYIICGTSTAFAWFEHWSKNRDPQYEIRNYTWSIRMSPHNVENYNMRGLAYYHARDYDAALKDFETANSKLRYLTEEHAALHRQAIINNFGLVYLARDQFDMALVQYNKGLALKNLTDAFRCVLFLNRGAVHLELYNMVPAMQDFDRCEALLTVLTPPEQQNFAHQLLYLRAMAQYRYKQMDLALDYWRQLLQSDKNYHGEPWLKKNANWRPWHIEAAKDLNTLLETEANPVE